MPNVTCANCGIVVYSAWRYTEVAACPCCAHPLPTVRPSGPAVLADSDRVATDSVPEGDGVTPLRS
jgi:hypothetical protein